MKKITLGKLPENNLVILGEQISRNHCSIEEIETGIFLIKDTSTHGTFVNHRQIKQTTFSKTDTLSLGNVNIDTELIFQILEKTEIPIGIKYDELKQQFAISQQFLKLKEVYDNFLKEKRKISRKGIFLKAILRGGLGMIPIVGSGIAELTGGVLNVNEKLNELNEKFKKEYICPCCFRFLGFEPFENLEKQKTCFYCKKKWIL